MGATRKIIVFALAYLFICSQPLFVFADECDDVMAEAKQTFNAAMAASKEKEFAKAIGLYEEAEISYQKASEMRNCSCPKTAGTAKKNIIICRNNAAKNRMALEKQGDYETYNRAKMKFNQGNSYARRKEWGKAIDAFEEAEKIWESIASTETENGRRAMQSAKQARNLANLARQKSGR